MGTPKNQHYVPRFILRQFLEDSAKEQVAVYDKQTDRGFTTSIDNVMSENRFHDFSYGEWDISFETTVTGVENLFQPAYRKVLDERRLDCTPQQKVDLAFFMAFQLIRTRGARNRFEDLEKALSAKLQALGHKLEDIPGWEPQTPDTVKLHDLMVLQENVGKFAEIIATKDFHLATPSPGRSFYLGDNPVCLHNSKHYGPYGNLGLAVRGIEIYMPLASDLMLCAWCPSLMEELRVAHAAFSDLEAKMFELHCAGKMPAATLKQELEAMRTQGAPAKALLDSVDKGHPLPSHPVNMDFFNSLQSSEASRFVVCQQSDFEIARRHNKEFPHLRAGRRFTFS